MVARQFASGRAVAVATAALFLLTLVPATPVQAQSVHDVSVVQGEAAFFQSTFPNKPTQFIDGGTLASTLSVPVHHTGASSLENATVYWNMTRALEDGTTLTRSGCVGATLPPSQGNVPGLGWANITLETRDLPTGAYNITVNAFTTRPPAVPAERDCRDSASITYTRVFTPGSASLSDPCQVPSASCQTDANTLNNRIRAYFIKNSTLDLQIQEIRWCEGTNPDDLSDDCDSGMETPEGPYNATSQEWGSGHATYFEVVVKNVGTWHNLSNYGGPCACAGDGFQYKLDVGVTGAYLNGTLDVSTRINTTNGSTEADGGSLHLARSLDFDLVNMSGRYNVTVKLDPTREIRFLPGQPLDVSYYNADVLYRDYKGNFTPSQLRTDPLNPYPYDGGFDIQGGVTFENAGTAGRLAGSVVRWEIYIDNATSPFRDDGTFTLDPAGASEIVPFKFHVTSLGTSADYIPPGKHTLIAKIDISSDPNEVTSELNESNNNFSIDIYVRDSTTPVLRNAPKITDGPVSLPGRTTFYPLEQFNVFANITDDDNGLHVVANATLDSNTSVYRTFTLNRTGGGTGAADFAVGISNFNYHNFSAVPIDQTENWTVRIHANDSSGNNVSSGPIPLRLIHYPIHNATADHIVMTPAEFPNQANITWDGPDEPRWKIRVEPNMTGYYGHDSAAQPRSIQQMQNQQNYTGNLAINITTAKDRTFNQNGTFWTAETPDICLTNTSRGLPIPGGSTCTPQQQAEENNAFSTSFSKTQEGAGPGLWNYSIRITDIAGHARVINGTYLIRDLPPTITNANISVDRVAPGGNFTVRANLSDDDDTITSAHVVFKRTSPADGLEVNLTLDEYEEEPGTGVTYYNYTQTFDTGRRTDFGVGGTFNASVFARDLTGNWANSSLGTFRIDDADAPVITEYGAVPSAVEVGENVTFYAKVSDATNTSVKLEIFRTASSSELLRDAIVMNESLDGNYTATLNFTDEAVHAFRLTPTDSVNLAGQIVTGTVQIRDNLGPKYEIRSPALVIDGTRYGSGTPRIEVVAFDVEGVNPASVTMKVAGLPVDHAVVPAPDNLNGFLITYDVKANKKFSHNDPVEVNITAEDNSSEHLTNYLNFTFIVDDVAPIARVSGIAPGYRDQTAHPMNISLNSRISLVADDNDGLPTGVESIRYRILGGGPTSAETVYTGPFKINDAPGVYQGPKLYSIQYWAEDAVGNFNRVFNTTNVFVDDTPPALHTFLPKGRFINASFVDDRVGVNRSVVWYRENSEPFIPLPLVEKDGAWTLTLPDGVKGDVTSYYLQAWDRLDNTETFGNASAPYATFRVDNREPTLTITAPIDGSRVFRNVDITWEADDVDGDALVFTVFVKAPGETAFRELVKIENSAARRYTLDTTRFQDGQYTFRIAASDGGFAEEADTTITIINSQRAVGVVSVPGSTLPGETLLVTAEVTKAEAVVEARLYLDGELVGAYPMNDEGKDGDVSPSDGIFSVRVPVEAAGEYSVQIYTQYREDGVLKEFTSDPQVFSAKLTPSYVLSKFGVLVAVIALLAAVGIGVAVFVVVRRR